MTNLVNYKTYYILHAHMSEPLSRTHEFFTRQAVYQLSLTSTVEMRNDTCKCHCLIQLLLTYRCFTFRASNVYVLVASLADCRVSKVVQSGLLLSIKG